MRAKIPLFTACLLAVAVSAHGQSMPPVTNIVQADGSVKALFESQAVVTTKFWTFLNNWSYVRDWETTGNGVSTFGRRGLLLPGYLNTTTQVSNSASATDLSFTAIPSRSIYVDSAHLNLMFDDAFWAGATLSDGLQTVTFSSNFLLGFTRWGIARTITVTKPNGFRLTITLPNNVNWSCQDSRQYFVGFELRLDERSGTWGASSTNTFRAKLEYSSGTPTVPDTQVVIQESAEWHRLPQMMSVATGSALDWKSSTTPSGSRGWLTVNSAGKFAFPGTINQAERFYGVNLTHYTCYPTRGEAVALVENLAKLGYNSVRLHHFDYVLTRRSADSTTIDQEMMDRLNYLVYELKQKGFYIKIDLHSMRTQKPYELFPAGDLNEHDYKALLLVSSAVRENFLTFVSNLLNTQNPYTGLKWKDEPAIAWMALGNENGPYWFTAPRSGIKVLLDAAVGGVWNPDSDSGSRAATQLCAQTAEYLATRIRAMGARSLFTNMNGGFNRVLAIGRKNLDYVDNHLYFAHPDNFSVPITQKNTSPLRKIEEIGWFASSKIAGKPFTVSEFDAVSPNQFRGEFGIMAGALGIVQKWDAMWRFQYADNVDRALNPKPMNLFSIASDPLAMATERAIVALYLRGDLTSNDLPYYVANPLGQANQREIREEPIVRQSVLAKPIFQVDSVSNSGTGIVYDGKSLNADQTVRADLNDLTLNVDTDLTAAVIGSEGMTLESGSLKVRFDKSRATVYLTSLDQQPLHQSRRMLLAHLTDVQNSGATFTGQERKTLTNWGTLPHLIRDGAATVSIAVKNARSYKVYRLDLAGNRIASVNPNRSESTVEFTAKTVNPSTGTGVIYYEIVAK